LLPNILSTSMHSIVYKKEFQSMEFKSFIGTVLIISFLAGCAGRAANPVLTQQYGDNTKSCKALEQELVFIQNEIQRLVPDTEKAGTNTALGVAGFFFIVPLFFMDLSQSEQIEINAFRQRYNHLLIIATDKKCGVSGDKIPEFK
jgi:hypothetical protein